MTTETPRGKLILIEGVDGTGKTTAAQGLATRLDEFGIPTTYLHSPSGDQHYTQTLYDLIKHVTTIKQGSSLNMHLRLLMAAANFHILERAHELCQQGRNVVLDRSIPSMVIYQKFTGDEFEAFATGAGANDDVIMPAPDYIFLLTASDEELASRFEEREQDVLDLHFKDRVSRMREEYHSILSGYDETVEVSTDNRQPADVIEWLFNYVR